MSGEEKDYIPGIYNYCDRWCEKCGFTSNCLLFTQESKIQTHEILNNGDTTGIEEVFKRDIEKMKDAVEEEDYDEDELYDFEEEEEEEDSGDFAGGGEKPHHPVEDLLDEYFVKSNTFLEALNKKYVFINKHRRKILEPPISKLLDDIETVMWYHAFIGAKIDRALFDLNDVLNEEDDEIKEIHQFDMNGSAKIAILSIRKSIDALNNLHNGLPEYSAEIEEILVLIGKVLNIAEELFPDCMSFIRPGLDE